MLSNTPHLLLPGFQVVKHLGLIVESRIDGQRLHRHAYGVKETLVGTTVVDGGEQRFLLIIILSQQKAIGRCKEVALENTFVFAESIHLRHVHTQRPHHRSL